MNPTPATITAELMEYGGHHLCLTGPRAAALPPWPGCCPRRAPPR
jgi:hypothetical protein